MCGCPEGHHTIYCPARPEPPLLPDEDDGVLMKLHPAELEALLAKPPADEAIGRPADWEPTSGPLDLDPAPAVPEEDYGPLDEAHPTDLPLFDPLRVMHNLTHHAPRPGQAERYEEIRSKAIDFALTFNRLAPDSNEKAEAHKRLSEALFWALAAIARNP